MSNRKSELRKIVEDIIFERQKEKVQYPRDLNHLKLRVSKVLEKQDGEFDACPSSTRQLSQTDNELIQEIFWDLFIERIITLGEDGMTRSEPPYRLHSEASNNAKCGAP
jgi:hypothetical protein